MVQPRAEHDLEVAERPQDPIAADMEIIGELFDYADQEEPLDTLWRETSFLCNDKNVSSEDRHKCVFRI